MHHPPAFCFFEPEPPPRGEKRAPQAALLPSRPILFAAGSGARKQPVVAKRSDVFVMDTGALCCWYSRGSRCMRGLYVVAAAVPC